jgi:hypothetical protein
MFCIEFMNIVVVAASGAAVVVAPAVARRVLRYADRSELTEWLGRVGGSTRLRRPHEAADDLTLHLVGERLVETRALE